mmetsp:Transcript_16172/g.29182  ORF Transcript_16172/g.29182 Transcript_16172/m.29182 type:complete len:418 (+) Transcript_16172:211-1464(+)|eukprot:CAMPEP_0196139114 /NCGR_PEP_ID=MMETSP0910-20130528/6502_1 /TAXON_ID=49265 /ORGANISM="Thalassiosira rotula, Strain GSO102" /LENGTH=417 /DNA_ID=CAMNT_0041399801 /DNA_START=161 /DNA_END=1414 /DNA_ORIENTATION=-
MKVDHLQILVAASSILTKSASSFSIDLSPNVQRDVYTMADWAANCGVQQAEGVQLTSYDGLDYFPVTQSDIPAGSPVMYVPNDIVISSSKVAQELGGTTCLSQCENSLVQAGLQDKVALFRIFFKVLAEYQNGEQSAYYPWLNSLPRLFNTGASMTYDCFDCLPPYAAYCAFAERQNLVNFQKAATPFTANLDSEVTKWAYNVAITRSREVNGERYLAPMVDMFNHGADTEVEISYDGNGECYAMASYDIPAGSPLRVSYGDPTDSTPLFATYGFLDESATGTFCKLMHMLKEMEELGYSFADLLFSKENGDISPQVYDVVLYHVLKKSDQNLAQQFYQAVMNGDEATKGQFQEQYWQYTKEELQQHVDGLLGDLDQWSQTASGYDLQTHPRVPLILQHNAFVKDTFLKVKAKLDYM